MHFVIFAAPWFSENATRFIEATVGQSGVRVAVVSQDVQEHLAAHLRDRIVAHWRVEDIFDAGQLAHAARELSSNFGPVHRLFGAYEQLQVPLAEAREMLGVEGMSAESARNFRDKSRMKNVLREAGVPCARHSLAHDEREAWGFVEEVGFPVVLKPPAGAGALSTFRVDDREAFGDALKISAPTSQQPVLIEEFITGEEHSLETISIGGRAVWHSLTHYYPTPLDVLRNDWIQWCVLLPREIDGPQYEDIRHAGARALEALGMDTGLTHMEWFRRGDGSVAISEVGARPPGAQITTLVSRANDVDFLHAWARVMVYGEFDPPERRYAAGAAFLRGQGSGRVVRIHGLEQAGRELGELVTDVKLPQVGQTPTGSYEGEGYVLLRHPETDVVKDALLHLISIVRVELG
ncbi:MAG TPA: ATP-grasp domain-containing protein [Pyrinomonadaceae bacterium]|jgi:biotin carboxylase|nr:ATP-grasp domain-containing protein [Pyrinomonadaceae bacterium]